MQMLCKVASTFSDVQCPVCGQGFLVYWTRLGGRQRAEEREGLLQGLRQQHGADLTDGVHAPVFHLPDGMPAGVQGGAVAMPSPALLGVYS